MWLLANSFKIGVDPLRIYKWEREREGERRGRR
jgi:hypothetical protein